MKTHRSMTSSSADPLSGEKGKMRGGSQLPVGSSHWPRGFLLKRLTCQSGIDLGAERKEPALVVPYLTF